MDQLESDLARFKQPAMAAVGGIAAALVVATLPHVYLESIVGATGLSEIVPAAAPPLGNTARGLIAVAAGLVSASVIFLYLNRKGSSDMSLAIRRNLTPDVDETESKPDRPSSKKSFSVKSLTKFLKKPKKAKVKSLEDLPDRRKADEHPDAPARPPLFATSDLGTPIADQIKPFANHPAPQPASAPEKAPQVPPVVSSPEQAPSEPNVVPTSFTVDRNLQAPEPVEPPSPVVMPDIRQDVEQPVAKPAVAAADLANLSIAQLADRLEAGLAELKALQAVKQEFHAAEPSPTADADPVAMPPLRSVETSAEEVPPPAAPALEAQAARQADMDAALKAALGTLERMTAQR